MMSKISEISNIKNRLSRLDRLGRYAIRAAAGMLLALGCHQTLTAQPNNLQIFQTAPPAVSSVGANYTGAIGNTTVYYWVVVRYPAGAAQATGPALATGTVGSQNLTASNRVTISWSGMGGASSYDVLRSDTPNYPAPCFSCAVTLATTSTSVNDTGGALLAYPLAGLGGVSNTLATWTIDNITASTPFINLQLAGALFKMALYSASVSPVSGNCVQWGAGGTLTDAGASCGTGGGGTVTTGVTLTAGLPVIGAGGSTIGIGTRSGNTTQYVTTTGAQTNGNCVSIDASGNHIASGAPCGSTAGTVTSVSWTGGIVSVATPTVTPAFTVAGTSGGIPYFSSASTWASSAALTANLPVIGGGAGVAPTVGTRSGNTTQYVTTTGSQTNGNCVSIDANGNHIAAGAACGTATLPTQTSNGGKFLATDGSTASWQYPVQILTSFSSLPAASASNTGWLYMQTVGGLVCRSNGTTYDCNYGPYGATAPPAVGSWTAVNSASMSTTTQGAFQIAVPASASINAVLGYLPVVAAPYTLTALLDISDSPQTGQNYCGLALLDTATAGKTAQITAYYSSGTTPTIVVEKYSNLTTNAGAYVSVTSPPIPNVIYLRFVDNNTNRIASYSTDGLTFTQLNSVSRTDFITPNAYGMWGGTVNASRGQNCRFRSWVVSQP